MATRKTASTLAQVRAQRAAVDIRYQNLLIKEGHAKADPANRGGDTEIPPDEYRAQDLTLEIYEHFLELVGIEPGENVHDLGLDPELMLFVDIVGDARTLLRMLRQHGQDGQQQMRRVLNGLNRRPTDQKQRRLAQEVAAIEEAATRQHSGAALILLLAQEVPEFALLRAEDVDAVLGELAAARAGKERGRRGGDALTAIGAAMQLAVMCGAHGFTIENYERNASAKAARKAKATRKASDKAVRSAFQEYVRDAYKAAATRWLATQNALGSADP